MKKILIIVVVVILGLFLVKDIIIQSVITSVGSSVLGAPVRVGHFSLNPFTQKIRIKNLKVYNPSLFPNEPLIDIADIDVDYDLPALLGGKLHLKLARLNMREMSIVKNKSGKLNVDSLNVTKETQKKEDKKPDYPSKEVSMRIDVMYLNISHIVYKDMTKDPAAIQAYDVGLQNKKFENITSAQQMIVLIMAEALKGTAIQSAGVMAASMILGVGFLPAGVAGVLLAKDSAVGNYNGKADKVYKIVLDVLQKMGEVKTEDPSTNMIKAKVDGADINVKITQKTNSSVEINVSARKMMIPQASTANGIIYQLDKRLRK